MKKLIIILCFLPLFSYSGNIYKALADTVFIGSIPYKTATGELIIFNSTKDTAGVLYNNGSGVTQFKKVRSIKLNDSTYVIKIGTSVIGDTIKILSSASSGGTVTDFTFTDGNGFDGTVTNSTTTPTLVLVADTLTKFASVMRLLDSITAINARVASTIARLDDSMQSIRNIRKVDTIYKSLDSIVFKINGIRYAVLDSTGGGVQTLSISGDTLSISGGNSVVLPVYVQVDSATVTSYDVLNSQNAPPLSPNVGDVYLVGNTPSGAWVGHAKDIAEWNGSAWIFTDGVQGDFLYNATNALTYIFRSGNWVQTTGIPALHNGNTISSGLKIGTRNNKDFNFISNNILRGGMLANGSFRVANQGGSGNVLVGADSLGVQRKLYIGDGLSLSNDSLLASGGGGSSAIFPNGGKIIEDTTYEITHSDAGYLLYFPYETTVTHSIANPLIEGDVIGVQFYDPNSIITMDATLVELYLYSQLQSGDAEKGEVAIFQAIQDGEILPLFGLKTDESDGGKLKTITRYLYDNSGGGSISGLTAATATNNILNTNYKQRWSWNTLAGDTALALNSSSTAAASNLNTLLAVTQSGTSSNVTQSTFGIKVSNTKVSTLGMNYALYAESSGSGGAMPYGQYNPAVYAKGVEAPIIMDNYSSTGGNYIDYRLGGTEQGYIGFNYSGSSNYFYIMNKLPKSIIIGTNNTNWLYVGNNSGAPQLGIGGGPTCPFEVNGTAVSNRIMKVHSGFIENDYAGDIAYVHTRGGNFGTIGVNSSGNFIIGINGAGTGTQIAIHATRDNVGMGTVTPVASAKLELSSTTQGLLISRGTTTNRDAISSPATLLQFGNTTSNTIDTYDGTRWTNGAKFLTNTATLDFGNTSAQTSADLTITVTGAADGDAVIIGVPNGSVNANSSYSAWVSSANTVTIRFNNYSSGSIDPASGIFKATVNK